MPSLFELSPEVRALKEVLDRFVEEECIPAEEDYEEHLRNRHGVDRWTMAAVPPILEQLKARAKELGLWNLFIPPHLISKVPDPSLRPSLSLSYREYGILCESLGRCPTIAPEACNTSAPDTGNMEVLLEFGTPAQIQRYLIPLLRGDIRSTFLMTEPAVASSDPTNLETKLLKKQSKNGDVEYILTGRKWWSTGAMDPRCRLALVVARMHYEEEEGDNNNNNSTTTTSSSSSNPLHGVHTIVAVPLPHPAVQCVRALETFGYDDAPHGHAEVELNGVPLTQDDLILGEGSGFRVSQARLGPGRIHHCMRAIGMAARCYELMLERSIEREAFGMVLAKHGSVQEEIADSVADLEAARLLTLNCAAVMDETGGARHARDKIALIKAVVPQLTYQVVDRAVQLFGGAGVSNDFVLARCLVGLRVLRIADGPDAVHKRTVARLELKKLLTNQSKL